MITVHNGSQDLFLELELVSFMALGLKSADVEVCDFLRAVALQLDDILGHMGWLVAAVHAAKAVSVPYDLFFKHNIAHAQW